MKGIQKKHHFTKTVGGVIIARDLSCLDCIKMGGICEKCEKIENVFDPKEASEQVMIEEDLAEVNDDDENMVEDDVDTSICGDQEEDDHIDSESEEDDSIAPGTVVWARLRSWYPAVICSSDEIPDKMKRLFLDHPSHNIFVKRFEPFNDFRIVKIKNLDQLGENRTDKSRAARSENINTAYCQALAKLRGDI